MLNLPRTSNIFLKRRSRSKLYIHGKMVPSDSRDCFATIEVFGFYSLICSFIFGLVGEQDTISKALNIQNFCLDFSFLLNFSFIYFVLTGSGTQLSRFFKNTKFNHLKILLKKISFTFS